jgi:hypothetical protein
MATQLTIDDLDLVTGAGVWNSVDKGISHVSPTWNDKACSSRASWVGWGVGTALGAGAWATWAYTGPAGQAVLGPINGLIGTYAVSSYIDNCESQKAAAKK